jgi:hypothetical protein
MAKLQGGTRVYGACTVDGNLLVGSTTNPSSARIMSNITSGSKFASFVNNANGSEIGSIQNSGGTATVYSTSSDYRLKENIATMTGALEKVNQLNPVTYTWKSTGEPSQGFIAHELQEIIPECVIGTKDGVFVKQNILCPAFPPTYDENGNELTPEVPPEIETEEIPVYQGVDTSFLVATLTAAIQELNAKVEAQAIEIQLLKETK